jgi:ferredoxin
MSRKTEPSSSPAMPVHRLWIGPEAQPVAAPQYQTLMLSAQQAGFELHTSCRNGHCRACLRRIVSGRVSYRIAWPGLSREEKDEGFLLPCIAYPQSDVVLEAES